MMPRWLPTICLSLMLLGGCALAPPIKTKSIALSAEEGQATRLGQALAPRVAEHPGKSGIHALADPHDAFAARVLLARTAERTLDIQYYIWRRDMTGTLLLEELHKAADRGVRVRLLLDDNGTSGRDAELAALALHPRIEVRLFNPFKVRSPKWLGFITDFSRANRRMHNKSFTADSQASIVGGRNIGDEYFGATEGVLFADLDVLAVGPIVAEVALDFDRYWASESSYPVEQIVPAVPETSLTQLEEAASLIETDAAARSYVEAVAESEFISLLLAQALPLEWAHTRIVSDDPAKGLGDTPEEGRLTYQLRQILGEPQKTVVLVSPYFVPTAVGVAAFTALAEQGVDVQILTNSFDATDVAVVHAGYAKRRKDLLKADIRLFELRRLSPQLEHDEKAGPFGSSGSSLHAKTFAVDGERMFVGSFNFDPRSANLNTELGFVIDSPTLARAVHQAFEEAIPASSYQVQLDDNGRLYWTETVGGQLIRHDKEPNTTIFQRGGLWFLSILPIEWLL